MRNSSKLSLLLLMFILMQLTGVRADEYDEMAQKTCECLGESKIKLDTRPKMMIAIGSCMITVAKEYSEFIKAEGYDVDPLLNNKDSERLGEQIGARIAMYCPEYLTLFLTDEDVDEMLSEDEEESYDYDVEEIEGEVTAVKMGDIPKITVRDFSGQVHDVIWIWRPESDFDLIDEFEDLEGQKVLVTYLEYDTIDLEIGGYRKSKVLNSISRREE